MPSTSSKDNIGQPVDTQNMSSQHTLQGEGNYNGDNSNDIEKALDPLEPQGTIEGNLDNNTAEGKLEHGAELERPASKDFPDLAPSRSMEFPDGMF